MHVGIILYPFACHFACTILIYCFCTQLVGAISLPPPLYSFNSPPLSLQNLIRTYYTSLSRSPTYLSLKLSKLWQLIISKRLYSTTVYLKLVHKKFEYSCNHDTILYQCAVVAISHDVFYPLIFAMTSSTALAISPSSNSFSHSSENAACA